MISGIGVLISRDRRAAKIRHIVLASTQLFLSVESSEWHPVRDCVYVPPPTSQIHTESDRAASCVQPSPLVFGPDPRLSTIDEGPQQANA